MDTGNRVLWTVVAVVLVAAGGLGVVAGAGRLSGVDRDTALLPEEFLRWWRDRGDWALAATIVAGLLLVLLGLLLVRAELRGRGGRAMSDLSGDDLAAGAPAAGAPIAGAPAPVAGRIRVRSGAIVNGIEHDLARHPAVRRAAVTLAGDPPAPHVRARIDVHTGSELAGLRQHVSTTLDRLTATTGLRPDSVDITLRIGDTAAARVR